MTILSKTDYAEIQLKSLIADYDYETMVNLYQPIIGFTAMSVYFTLIAQAKTQRVYSIAKLEDILVKMQMSCGVFNDARRCLEAVGLIKTFVSYQKEENVYHYDIYAPRTPSMFFDNAILYGMLIKCLGEEEAEKIKKLYPQEDSGFVGEDISAKFTDVFHPQFDDKAFLKAAGNTSKSQGKNFNKISGNFNYDAFFKALQEISQLRKDALDDLELRELYRIATLYGIDEVTAANYVVEVYDPNLQHGKRVNFKQLTKLFQNETDFNVRTRKYFIDQNDTQAGDTALAKKIKLMESKAPKQYLALLQNGTKPATADLKILDDISRDYHLPNSIINVLVEYTLFNCDNILQKSYIAKVASSIVRENIETTIDAMNYLMKVKEGRNNKLNNVSKDEETVNENSNEESSKKDEGPSWDELIDFLDQGGSDGKA